jgi:S-(hydroxymethyl)glutathione dehydrogenase / alcohol dehydrogenase
MRAVVMSDVGQPLAVEHLQVQRPQAGEVRIKLVSAGVCHSDLHVLRGDWKHRTPIVLGHEGAGVVVEVGDGVIEPAVGDHVIISWMPACGACAQCLRGRPWLCEAATGALATDSMFDGTTRLCRASGELVYQYLSAGVFAEEVVVRASGAVKVRDDAPLGSVSIIGCAVATGFGAVVNTAQMEWGSSMAVIGLGAVGLSAIQGGVHSAARRIIAVDIDSTKLEVAKRFGATDVVDASAVDPAAAVKELTGGIEYVFECSGRASSCEQAVKMLGLHGMAVIVGQPEAGTTSSYDGLLLSCYEHRIVGSNYGSIRPHVDFPKLVDLYMRGDLMIDELITGRRPLDEAQQAFDDLVAGRALRTVLNCRSGSH